MMRFAVSLIKSSTLLSALLLGSCQKPDLDPCLNTVESTNVSEAVLRSPAMGRIVLNIDKPTLDQANALREFAKGVKNTCAKYQVNAWADFFEKEAKDQERMNEINKELQ